VDSYNIYRAPAGQAPGTISFERIGSVTAATNSFRDPHGSTSGYQYMVRAAKREDGPSGAYYNLSQGAFSHGISHAAPENAGATASIVSAQSAVAPASTAVLDAAFAGTAAFAGVSIAFNSGHSEFEVPLPPRAIDAAISDDELLNQLPPGDIEPSLMLNVETTARQVSRRSETGVLSDDLDIDFESLADDEISAHLGAALF
jgi:hypothetical protein